MCSVQTEVHFIHVCMHAYIGMCAHADIHTHSYACMYMHVLAFTNRYLHVHTQHKCIIHTLQTYKHTYKHYAYQNIISIHCDCNLSCDRAFLDIKESICRMSWNQGKSSRIPLDSKCKGCPPKKDLTYAGMHTKTVRCENKTMKSVEDLQSLMYGNWTATLHLVILALFVRNTCCLTGWKALCKHHLVRGECWNETLTCSSDKLFQMEPL